MGAALVGLICSAGVLGWQYLTVRYNYQGNWSALFCTGSYFEAPPLEEFRGTYLFQGSFGYDGQFYRYIAHDPFLKRGLWKSVDAPQIRYRRILVPGLAYAGGLGRPRAIDTAYLAVTLGFVFLGGYWASRYAVARGRHPAWGLAFVLTPAVLVSADRMVVDAALAALCCGWALYWGEESGAEDGAVRGAGGGAAGEGDGSAPEPGQRNRAGAGADEGGNCRSGRRRFCRARAGTRSWRRGQARGRATGGSYVAYVPLEGFIRRVLHPLVYPPGSQFRGFFIALDYVALAGIALALGLGIRLWLRRRDGAIEVAVLLFSLLAIQTGPGDVWTEAFAFGRVFSPLLLLLALKGLETGRKVLALPLALVTLRVGAQFGGQAIGVVRGL